MALFFCLKKQAGGQIGPQVVGSLPPVLCCHSLNKFHRGDLVISKCLRQQGNCLEETKWVAIPHTSLTRSKIQMLKN